MKLQPVRDGWAATLLFKGVLEIITCSHVPKIHLFPFKIQEPVINLPHHTGFGESDDFIYGGSCGTESVPVQKRYTFSAICEMIDMFNLMVSRKDIRDFY